MPDFFTDLAPDNRIWTAGFLNERFPEPVSPLGWTLIRDWFEELALRAPLRYLGVRWPAHRPLTRLYRGHPYADAQAFWALYKVFPDFILPDDAVRYFPGGQIALRKTAPQPAGLFDPRLAWALARSALADLGNWSPWHNWRAWKRFEAGLASDLKRGMEVLDAAGSGPIRSEAVWAALQEAQGWTRRLLSIHRWSLTHADLCYTLLRRLLGRAADADRAGELSAYLACGVQNLSLELDAALARLATLRRSGPPDQFKAEFAVFLAEHGHRSFSLDIVQPTFAARPETVLTLLDQMPALPETDSERQSYVDALQAVSSGLWGPLLRHVLGLVRVYMGLREDQRYRWQQILALMRRWILLLAERWVSEGRLDEPEDAFFVTWSEFAAAAQGQASLPGKSTIRERKAQFADLEREYRADPAAHYPVFLQGDEPYRESVGVGQARERQPIYWGRAASPGVAQGPVRRVIAAGELATVEPGAVLLARSTDPGWTPVFRRIAALVTETGGVLSHGAVVAREYGLPAVVAAADAFDGLQDGQWVEVDGRLGKVSVLSRPDVRSSLGRAGSRND